MRNQYGVQMRTESDELTLKKFGANLRMLRKEKDLSIRQLSHLCKVDYSKIGEIERGRVNLTLLTMKELAQALDVPPSRLLDFKFE